MFKNGTNKTGLLFFIILILALFIFITWQISNVDLTENVDDHEVKTSELKFDEYQVILDYQNSEAENILTRYKDKIHLSTDGENAIYLDLTTKNIYGFNPSLGKWILMDKMTNDFELLYDPLNLARFTLENNYDKVISADRLTYKVFINDLPAEVEFNNQYLPQSLAINNQPFLQYNYLKIGNIDWSAYEINSNEIEN